MNYRMSEGKSNAQATSQTTQSSGSRDQSCAWELLAVAGRSGGLAARAAERLLQGRLHSWLRLGAYRDCLQILGAAPVLGLWLLLEVPRGTSQAKPPALCPADTLLLSAKEVYASEQEQRED